MYDNIIFDLYGTLIDIHTDEEDIAVWKHMCEFYAQHGVKYNPAGLRSRYKRQVRRAEQAMAKKKFKFPEIQILDVFEQLTKKKDQTADDCAELTVMAAQEFRRASTEYIRLYDGVKELLESLKNAGRKLYVLSNAQRVYTMPELQQLGIDGYFEDISLSSDFGAMKPDAAFYQQALDRNHLNPNKSIMVGNDAVCDIMAARQARLHTCYMHSQLSPVDDAERDIKADFVLDKVDIPEHGRLLLGGED